MDSSTNSYAKTPKSKLSLFSPDKSTFGKSFEVKKDSQCLNFVNIQSSFARPKFKISESDSTDEIDRESETNDVVNTSMVPHVH